MNAEIMWKCCAHCNSLVEEEVVRRPSKVDLDERREGTTSDAMWWAIIWAYAHNARQQDMIQIREKQGRGNRGRRKEEGERPPPNNINFFKHHYINLNLVFLKPIVLFSATSYNVYH